MEQVKMLSNAIINSAATEQMCFLTQLIKFLVGKIEMLEKTVSELTESLNKKVEIDEKHIMKEKGNLQMKKIFKGDYVPQEDWNKLSNVQKALHNIRDFAQYPKPSLWKNFKDDEKLRFFEEKIKWNRDRAIFLRTLAEGGKLPEEIAKYNWNQNISLSRAITSNLYYGDKFSDGFQVKEFQDLWKKSNKELRLSSCNERMKLKGVLRKLNEKKKIEDAFVYYQSWFIKIDGLYWDANMPVLKEKAWKKFDANKRYQWDKKFGGKKRYPDYKMPIPEEGAEYFM